MKNFLVTLWFGIREPFSKTNYAILFVILFLCMLILFTLIPVWTVTGNTLATQLKIFTPRDYAILILLSGLSALFITMQVYAMSLRKKVEGVGRTVVRKQIIYLSLIAFILHFIWENTQAPLFQGYTSFSQHFLSCLMGTVGDVAITLSIYFVVALLKSNFNWIATLNKKDITILTTVGFFVAVGIERRALLFGGWAYADAMPIIPYLKVGLTPILQMTILLPFSVYLTKKLVVIFENR